MRLRIEESLEIVAVAVITLNALVFSGGFTVYDRIQRSEEMRLLYLDPAAPLD